MTARTDSKPTHSIEDKSRKQGSPLLYLLGFVFVLFIGILIFCYLVTKRANPVMLDAQGHPVTQSAESSHH